MGNISTDEVRRLARLAQLSLSEDEVAGYQQEFEQILEYVKQLQAVDVGDRQPTGQVSGLEGRERPDEPRSDDVSRDDLLNGAPDSQDGYIKVKKVL